MRRAWLCIVLLSMGAMAGLYTPEGPRLTVDASAESLSADPLKARSSVELLVMFSVPDQWNGADIRAIGKLARRLQQLRGVRRVESPFSARIPSSTDGLIEVATLLDRLDAYPSDARHWINETFDEPLLKGRMTNQEGQAVVMRVTVKPGPDKDNGYSRRALEIIQDFLSGQTRFAGTITGATVVQEAIGSLILHDLSLVLSLTVVIIPVVLGVSFSGALAIVLPMLSIALALLWTLGAMAMLGINLNLVTSIVPPLVIALTLAYSMHALSAHAKENPEEPIRKRVVGPLLVTAVTTLAGFLALSIQAIPAMRGFSFAGGIGVVAATLAVILVQCYGVRSPLMHVKIRPWLGTRLNHFVSRVHHVMLGRRRLVIGVALALFCLGVIGALRLEPGVEYIRDLPEGNSVRDDFDLISSSFGGANGFDIVVEGAGEDAVLLPSVLSAVDGFQDWLNQQPEVGGTTSLVDYVKRLNQAFGSGEKADYQVPNDFNLIKQLLMIGAPSEVERFASLDYSSLSIQVRTPLDDVGELSRLLKRIEQRIETLPSGVNARLEGDAVTLTRTVSNITSGQALSLLLAIVAIYLVIAAVFSSWQMGLRAMLPNLLPIAVYYGLIGLLGIPLSPTMALVACIVLGIAVDDTLFYLVRFNAAARRTASESQAAEVALKEVITPITLTTVALCLCFLTMTTSQFESQTQFALLAAFTLAVAWVSDLVLTPSIGARSSIVTLWDVLSVDLGTAPEETIPLLKDMTPRQARLFALLSRIEEIPAGKCFIRTGDPAGDIYVVIEGEAYAWFERQGEEVRLAEFKRGNTFGEASSFIKHRTANVTAETNLRVLAFDPNTLDRIRRRYPKIAALVFRNLGSIQAIRLDRTTRKLEELSRAGVTT